VTPLTFGQKLADRVAAVGGSWSFIIGFSLFLSTWAAINIFLGERAFDAYPFVFLNLILSMLAALQAPVIMMSQNRHSQVDRETFLTDLRVDMATQAAIEDLHAEITRLNAKIDSLLSAQKTV
jgi:uncharacterized membrane protein